MYFKTFISILFLLYFEKSFQFHKYFLTLNYLFFRPRNLNISYLFLSNEIFYLTQHFPLYQNKYFPNHQQIKLKHYFLKLIYNFQFASNIQKNSKQKENDKHQKLFIIFNFNQFNLIYQKILFSKSNFSFFLLPIHNPNSNNLL